MYHHINSKEELVQSKTNSYDDLIPDKIEDDGSYVTGESSTDDDKEELKAAKGIFFGLIFCVILYLWVANFLLWLF